jgi:hypothetical protein
MGPSSSKILPSKGRWLAEGLTEGCHPIERGIPLHHFVVPLPLQGRNVQFSILTKSSFRNWSIIGIGHDG